MSGINRRGAVGSLILALAVTLAGACDNDPAEVDDGITAVEATALATALVNLPNFEADDSISDTIMCPAGGQISVTGTSMTDETAAMVTIDATLVPQACRLPISVLEFTVDGNPSVRLQASFNLSGLPSVTVSGTLTGNITWQAGDRTGPCPANLSISGTVVLMEDGSDSTTGTVTGTLCGQTVNLRLEDLPNV